MNNFDCKLKFLAPIIDLTSCTNSTSNEKKICEASSKQVVPDSPGDSDSNFPNSSKQVDANAGTKIHAVTTKTNEFHVK